MTIKLSDQPRVPPAATAESSRFDLLQGVTAPVLVLDGGGRVLWMNDICETLVGIGFPELQGTRFWERLVEPDSTAQAIQSCVKSPTRYCVLTMVGADGSSQRIRWDNRWIADPDGSGTILVMTGAGFDYDQDAVPGVQPREPVPLSLQQIWDHAIFTLDRNGTVSSWSIAAQSFMGYRADKVLGQHLSLFFPTENGSATRPQQQLATASRVGWSEDECWCVRQDGRRLWAKVVVTARFGRAGQLIGYTVYVRDNTEKKRAGDMVARLGRILDDSLNEIYVFNADTLRFQQVNFSARRNLGFTLEELESLTPLDIKPDFSREMFDRLVEPLRNGEAQYIQFETSQLRKDGSRYPVEARLQLLEVDDEPVFVASVLDLTERKQVESALQRTEGRLQTLFDSAAEFFFVIDPDGHILLTNRNVSERSGYSEQEMLGRKFKEFFTPESRESCDSNFHKLIEQGHLRGDIEFECKNGEIIQMECSATGIPDEQGQFSSFLIIQRDVTERQRTAAALAESERRFRAIFNSQFQFIGLLDARGTVLESNQTALEFCGLRNEDVVGRPFWETGWWDISQQTREQLKDAIREAAAGKLVRYEVDILGKDCAIATIDFSLKPVFNDQGETVLIIPEGRDITIRKRAEEEARRHQQESAHVLRLSTMGEMASGMAHELNQPLTALISYCESAVALSDSLPEVPEKLGNILQRATEQAHRAGDIIRHLRHFVSKDATHMEPVELDQVIRRMMDFLEWEQRNCSVSIELDLAGGKRSVSADRVQIEQVLINLVRNSLEAIGSAGISDGRIVIRSRLRSPGSIEVTLTDNGPGVEAKMRAEIFDPFRSSKPSGMGMGLSISRSIIEAHGGHLWLNENHQPGASFGFELPLCD